MKVRIRCLDCDRYSDTPLPSKLCPLCRSPKIRFVATWRDANGRQHSTRHRTRGEANAALAQATVDRKAGRVRNDDGAATTLGEWVPRWLGTKTDASTKHRNELARWANGPALAPWHGRPLGSFRRSDLLAILGDVRKRYSPSSATRFRVNVLRPIFEAAVAEGLLDASPFVAIKSNDAEREAPKRRPVAATRAGVHAIADAIEPRYRALVLLEAYVGLRPSEAYGLAVDDVDFLRREIRVGRRVVAEPTAGVTQTKYRSKTGGVRFVKVPAAIVDELARFLHDFPIRKTDARDERGDAYVFRAPGGGPVAHANYRNRAFYPALVEARKSLGRDWSGDLPRGLTPYGMRHSAASIAAELPGVKLHEVGAMLGHRQDSTTRRYVHLFDERAAELAAGLDELARQSLAK